MRVLLNRKLVVPTLLAVGLLTMIGGNLDAGAWIDAGAIGYWIIAGWIEGYRSRRRAARPAAPVTARVAASSSRMQRSDGAQGAFSRLDPAWRNWISGETDARYDRRP
jgi:hypothetical protein